jgi:RNA polymerase sigma-70 factor (ECF subfamily)
MRNLSSLGPFVQSTLLHTPVIMQNSKEHAQSSHHADIDLVKQIAAGNDDALRALYAVYGQRLYVHALRLTHNPLTAEDAVQEAWVAVWHDARRFRGEGRVIAWLLSIVHHKALNLIRGRSPVFEDADEINVPADTPSLDEQFASCERAELIQTALERLSLKHRIVLELVFYQGLSLNEVAQVCDCPVGTVKSRLNYAKSSLYQILRQQGLSAEEMG